NLKVYQQVWRVDMLRHQGLVLFGRVSKGKAVKEVSQVEVWLKTIGLGCLDQGIQGSTCLRPFRIAGKQPVLSPHHKRPDGVFHQVVIRRKETGINISYQTVPLTQGIGNSLA